MLEANGGQGWRAYGLERARVLLAEVPAVPAAGKRVVRSACRRGNEVRLGVVADPRHLKVRRGEHAPYDERSLRTERPSVEDDAPPGKRYRVNPIAQTVDAARQICGQPSAAAGEVIDDHPL